MDPHITEDELADFIAWNDKAIKYISKMRGARPTVLSRRLALLEELRQRAFAKKPVQVEMFNG